MDKSAEAPKEIAAEPKNGGSLWEAASTLFARQQSAVPLKTHEHCEFNSLSLAQERLWQLQQSEPGAPYYHVTLAWEIAGVLNVAALERSLDYLVQRHEQLRACFPESESGPRQKIAEWNLLLPAVNLEEYGPEQRREQALERAREFARRPFNLTTGPLARGALYRSSEQEHLLVFVIHQMLFDGTSMRILSRELAECYRAFSQSNEPRLEPLSIRYSDFAQWQRDCLQGEVLRRDTDFWRQCLSGDYEPLGLPTDYPRRNVGITPGAQCEFHWPAALSEALKGVGREQGITPFATLLASFQTFLGVLTGQADILTLVTIAGRNAPELRRIIGLVANVVPMRLTFASEVSFRQALRAADQMVARALEHQALPLSRILEMMRLGSVRTDVPALQVMVLYNNSPLPVMHLPNAVFRPCFEIDTGTARFDLLLDVADSPEGFQGHIKYRSDLFKRETVASLVEDWQHFVEQTSRAPDKPLAFKRPFSTRAESAALASVSPQMNGNGAASLAQPTPALESAVGSSSSPAAFAPPRDALEQKLTGVWERVFARQPIGIHDSFFSLGGHSLLALKLIAAIERECGCKLRLSTLFQDPTIARLAAALRRNEARTPSSIVEIQPGGAKPPLFLVHGVGGGMFWGYNNLAHHLGADQPVFGFKSRGLDGLEEFDNIRDMASHYVTELRTFRPQGPYYLGGYCFGGNVAYEMARQLTAQGQSVALLVLMNCWPNNSSYTRISWTPLFVAKALVNFCVRLRHQIQRGAQQPRDYFKWRTAWLSKRLRAFWSKQGADRLAVEDFVDLTPQPEPERRLWSQHVQAWLQYQPEPYAGRIVLFRTRGHPLICSFDHEMGWGNFAAGGVEVRICPGDHESILDEENAPCTARELSQVLEAARKQHSLSP